MSPSSKSVKYRQWIAWYSSLYLLLLNGFFYGLLLLAYQHPQKQVILDINRIGEATVELIIFPIVSIVALVGQYYLLRQRRLEYDG